MKQRNSYVTRFESRLGYYTGQTEFKEFNGYGLLEYFNRNSYEGYWKNGRYHGKGKLILLNNCSCEGEFLEGKFIKGVMKKDGGEVYDGPFSDFKLHGKGKFTNGSETYDGDFNYGKYDGLGELKCNGEIYLGNFNNGIKFGDGIFIDKKNNRYEGDFSNNTFNGKGTMICASGIILEGNWKNGIIEGFGSKTLPCEKKISGYFSSDNTINGKGTCVYVDGSTYEGEIINDVPNGQGTLTFLNGTSDEGFFRGGKLFGGFQKGNVPTANGYYLNGRFYAEKEKYKVSSFESEKNIINDINISNQPNSLYSKIDYPKPDTSLSKSLKLEIPTPNRGEIINNHYLKYNETPINQYPNTVAAGSLSQSEATDHLLA